MPMKKHPINWAQPWVVLLCLVFAVQRGTAQYVEISAEIETFGYRLGDTNSIAKAKPQKVSVVCITGLNEWYIENTLQQHEKWLFDGTNVWQKTWLKAATGTLASGDAETFKRVWKSQGGNPLGDFSVNLPWLAFCSGTFLKGEGRRIPLPAAVLSACPDRFAYSDFTTTFDDQFGLPRSVDLFTSRALFLTSHQDWDKECSFGDRYTAWENKTVSKLQEGVLVFHYAVLETTNLLGRNFPTRFEFFQTGRQYETDGNWFCQGTGRVKSIRPSTKPPALE